VLGPDGAPQAGVPIVLGASMGSEPDRIGSGGRKVGNTGADGVVQVTEPPHYPEDASWFVFVDAPGMELVRAPIDLDAPPEQPVELRLPPYGTVEVAIEAVPGWSAADHTVRLRGLFREVLNTHDTERNTDARGIATFPFAAVGRPMELRWDDGVRAIDAPKEPGSVFRTRLDAADRPTLLGRLLDPKGRPVRRTDLSVVVGQDLLAHRSSTDAEGRFAVFVPSAFPGPLRCEIWPKDSAEPASAVIDLAEVPRGVMDSGEHRLAPRPFLAAGRVRPAGGGPLPALDIAVECLAEEHDSLWDPSTSRLWYTSTSLRAHTAADGSFTVYGPTLGLPMRLVAQRAQSDAVRVEVPFTPGQRDLDVVLPAPPPKPNWIRYRIALHPELANRAHLVIAGNDPAHDETRGPGEEPGGSLRIAGPGPFDLTVRPFGFRDPVAVVPGIRRVGPRLADPRLEPIDLNGKLRELRVRVTDAGGALLREARGGVRGVPAAGEPVAEVWPFRDGVATAIGPAGAVTLEILATGFLPARRQVLPGESELTVVLEPAPPLTLRFPELADIPRRSARLILHNWVRPMPATPERSEPSYLGNHDPAIGEDGQVRFACERGGRPWGMVWLDALRPDGTRIDALCLLAGKLDLTGAVEVVDVELNPAHLAELRERLR
jgi:hypothetical protein